MVACEESGDYLGGTLIKELKHKLPEAIFWGVGGTKMIKEGLTSIYDMRELTALGITEIVHRIPKLLSIRNNLARQIIALKADIMIGIDSPDFNLGLEKIVHRQGIKTVHYISPSLWAWRPNRVFTLAKATDLVLCCYPFEPDFFKKLYKEKGAKVNTVYIGHPIADEIALYNSKEQARKKLKLPAIEGKYIAILPGSRSSEISRLGEIFIDTAAKSLKTLNELNFLFSCINNETKKTLISILKKKNFPLNKCSLFVKNNHDVIAASDAVLLASGTASLETMLIKRPMVVAYKFSPITKWIAKLILRNQYISNPNLLFNKAIVPEFYTNNVNADNLCKHLLQQLTQSFTETEKDYTYMHKKLRRNAARTASEHIQELLYS